MLQLKRASIVFVWFSILCGLLYPLAVTGIAHTLLPCQAGGSLIKRGNIIIGSKLIGQSFTRPNYFSGRPSAIDPPYDASNSNADNLAPSSAKLIEQALKRATQIRRENGLSETAAVPADLALASASGLDPHITPASALLQADRVARERHLPKPRIEKLIAQNTEQPLLGIWGGKRVNVLELNLALDALQNAKQ